MWTCKQPVMWCRARCMITTRYETTARCSMQTHERSIPQTGIKSVVTTPASRNVSCRRPMARGKKWPYCCLLAVWLAIIERTVKIRRNGQFGGGMIKLRQHCKITPTHGLVIRLAGQINKLSSEVLWTLHHSIVYKKRSNGALTVYCCIRITMTRPLRSLCQLPLAPHDFFTFLLCKKNSACEKLTLQLNL